MTDISFKRSNFYQKRDTKMELIVMCLTAVFPIIRYNI